MRFLPYPFLLLTTACVPLGTPITSTAPTTVNRASAGAPGAAPALRYADYIYSPAVQSVQCYVATGTNTAVFQPPVVPLGQSESLALEFDVLGDRAPRLTARLVYCDANWQPSTLIDNQFLSDINEFLITDYRIGIGGKVPFFHYALRSPSLKVSGNYLWVVQDGTGAPLLSRRLLVYENQVAVALQLGLAPGGDQRFTLQQLNFGISYGGVDLVNPAAEVQVVLRQNFRWDNARYGLRPTFVRDAERRLDYQYFNYENTFPGLSEYRYFDTRSIQTVGQNVLHLDLRARPTAVALVPETTRAGVGYFQYIDANGRRVFESREYGNGATNADYTDVTFQLRADQPAPGPVYVLGALTDWQLKDAYRLTYDAATHLYTGHALLKQGYYNYDFAVARPDGTADETYFEGSHYETENQYDLLVYYRPPGTRTDLLIGYQAVDANARP